MARIVHRPSFAQKYETLWETIENGYQPPPSLAAIVYSILFSALVAMSEEQVFELCRCSRQELKDSLQLGTELALGQAHLLRASKTETIQAFVAYLVSHHFLFLYWRAIADSVCLSSSQCASMRYLEPTLP